MNRYTAMRQIVLVFLLHMIEMTDIIFKNLTRKQEACLGSWTGQTTSYAYALSPGG